MNSDRFRVHLTEEYKGHHDFGMVICFNGILASVGILQAKREKKCDSGQVVPSPHPKLVFMCKDFNQLSTETELNAVLTHLIVFVVTSCSLSTTDS